MLLTIVADHISYHLSLKKADELINSARVVLVENDIPETLQPNGTLIQLHQGTPIMQLFLDSKEPIKI